MHFQVLLSLRVTQPTWRPESNHMTSVLDLQTAGKEQFGKFAFQLSIISLEQKWEL